MSTWQNEFHTLFKGYQENDFDENFYENIMREKKAMEEEPIDTNSDTLNSFITFDEVKKVLGNAKNNKSVGIDSLPNEVLKNTNSCMLLQSLFNKIFVTHIIPSVWKRSIIKTYT